MRACRVERRAPAKVNLGLRITGVRADGYHLLESLFLPVDLADRLSVSVEPGEGAVTLELEGPAGDLPVDARNLAVRAAREFLDAMRAPAFDVHVRLDKQIPVGAGLGGGSSDAAAVLSALAELLPDAVAPARVREIALSLGADVPFFLDPRPARVTGVGERIEPLEDPPALWLVLLNPGISLATAQVYAAFDALGGELTPPGAGPTMRALWGPALVGELPNDLQAAAVRLCPAIATLLRDLRDRGARATGMSGSGATVFGVFPDEASARRAVRGLEGRGGLWVRIARTPGREVETGIPGASPNW